jgi:hypothetical protein
MIIKIILIVIVISLVVPQFYYDFIKPDDTKFKFYATIYPIVLLLILLIDKVGIIWLSLNLHTKDQYWCLIRL